MTLITLISGQLMPNLFSVIMLKPEKVVLVHTIDSKEDAVFFSEFIKNQKYGVSETDLIEVEPFNPEELIQSASRTLEKIKATEAPSDSVVLNYTAGTKPMSIAFYTIFKEAGARLLYIDTQQETCWWTKREEIQEQRLQIKLNIPEVVSLKRGKILVPMEDEERIIHTLRELTTWVYLQKKKNRGSSTKFSRWISGCVDLQQSLNNRNKAEKLQRWKPTLNFGFLSLKYDTSKPALMNVKFRGNSLPYCNKEFWLTYFTGGWFEHYVFKMLNETDSYDDVRCNIKLKTNDDQNPQLKNEIDVMAVKNGIPLFIECKTGLVNQKSITNLKTVSEMYGGRYGEAVLVALHPKISPAVREKIKDYGIHLIEQPNNIEKELPALHEYMVIKK